MGPFPTPKSEMIIYFPAQILHNLLTWEKKGNKSSTWTCSGSHWNSPVIGECSYFWAIPTQSSPLNLQVPSHEMKWLHEHELPMVSGNNLSTSSTWASQLRKFQGGKYLIISQWKKLPITYKTFGVHRHHHQHHHKTPANNLAQGHQHL